MQKFQDSIVNRSGDASPGASITVTTLTGVAASLFSDNGVTPISGNVIKTDANGMFFFYAANGRYNLVVSGPGIVAYTRTDVLLDDSSDDFYFLRNFSGIVGDGVHNDAAGIVAAIAACKLTGKRLVANAEDNYYLGTFLNSPGASKFLIDFNNFVFQTNNCKFSATFNSDPALYSSTGMTVFEIRDASNVFIGDFQCSADYCERTLGTSGVVAVWINTQAANSRGLTIGTITGTNLVSCITGTSASPATYRHRALRFDKLINDGGYYTLNLANNCDDVAGNIYSNNGVRSYFIYGCQGHKVKVYSTNHYKFTDILIKRYGYDTFDIHVDYNCPSDNSSNASISVEHENTSDNGTISNVYVNFNVVKSNPANPTLNFVTYDNTGTIIATTNSVTDNVHVSGVTNSTVPVVIGSAIGGASGLNVSRLFLQKNLLTGLKTFRRFIVYDSLERVIARSNATDGMAIKFNVSEYEFTPNWGLLTVYGADNPGASSAEYIIRQLLILFTVNSAGNVTVGATTTISTQTAGALGPTITFPNQTATFNLEVDVNNYTNAGRECSATLEIYRLS